MTRLVGGIMALLLSFGSTGCWDRRELESLAFVTAMGIDEAGDNKLSVTVIVAVPGALAGGGGSGGRSGGSGGGGGLPVLIMTSKADTVGAAIRHFDQMMSRRITLLQTQIVVFGEALARKGLSEHMEILTRFREFRRTVQLAVAEGKAEDYWGIQPGIETDPVKYTASLLEESQRNAGPPDVRTNDFLVVAESRGAEAVLPILRVAKDTPDEHVHPPGTGPGKGEPGGKPGGGGGGAKATISPGEVAGCAIFDGDRMVGKLDRNETYYFMVGSGRLGGADRAFPLPRRKAKWITMRILKSTVRVETSMRGGRPDVLLKILMPCDVLETQGSESPTDARLRASVERTIERDTTLGLNRVIRKTQGLRTDIFQWGERYRPKFATWPQFVAFHWEDAQFPKARVRISVDARIPRTGSTFEPATLR